MDKDKTLYNPEWDEHGYIQVYTGDGKGKTTASLGLAMRALGRDWKVILIMFTKGGNKYAELNSFRNLSEKIQKNLTIYQAGTEHIVYSNSITDEDRKIISDGWKKAKDIIQKNECHLLILDELNIAISLGIIDVNDDEANSVSKDKQASKIVIALSREKILLVNSYKRRGLFNISLGIASLPTSCKYAFIVE